MEGQQDLATARQLKQDGKSALDRGNSTEAKQKLSQALALYNSCIPSEKSEPPSYGPNNPSEIASERDEVKGMLANL